MTSFLDRKIISKEYYQKIIDIFKELICENKKISLLIYGSSSFKRDDLNCGISDIDGILCLNYDFITDKNNLKEINNFLIERFNGSGEFKGINPNPLMVLGDISTIDLGIAKDGRFIPYGDNFSGVMDNLGKEDIFGRDFRKEINLKKQLSPLEYKIGSGLDSIRKYVILKQGVHFWKTDERNLQFNIMQMLMGFGRKVAGVYDNLVVEKKKEGIKYLENRFNKVDITPIKKTEFYCSDIDKLSNFLTYSKSEVNNLILDGLTYYETILQKICKT